MNTQIRRLAVGLLVCYVALFVQLNVLQVGRVDQLNADVRNQRLTERELNRPRGPIITADGVVVAESVRTQPGDSLKYQRQYPLGDIFSNITGYYTFGFGSTQIERSHDDILMGDTDRQRLLALPSLLGGGENTGSVVLNLRADVQRVAAEALGFREGSVVVMDPRTGAIIAMVSTPRFDANRVAVHSASQARQYLEELDTVPGKPLLNNAYQERYMPGSAFKVITSGIALENGVTSMEREFPSETEYVPPQTNDPIQNFQGESCGGSMPVVFYRSCNIAFARMAIELGPERMVAGVDKWGVGEKIPIDMPGAVASDFGEVSDFTDALPLLAIGGFGQGNDTMVPLHMAMVASTVANGGQMMAPHVIKETRAHDGSVLDTTEPALWKTPIQVSTAETLKTLMVGVVQQGTGRSMQLAPAPDGTPIQAAAKTGTAQLNSAGEPEKSNAWIVGFAPVDNPQYAIAVMLKGGENDEISAGTGGRLAGPVAKTVLDHLFANPR